QRRNGAERRPQIAQRAVARFEREIFARPERFDARRQLLQPGERVTPRALILVLNGRFPGGELRVGVRVARGEIRIDGDAAADIGPFAAHHAELSPRRRQIVDARRARRFVGELREPRLTPLGVLARGVIGRFAARPRLRFLRLAARRRRFFLRARPFGSREPLRLLARPLLVLGGARLCRQPRGPFRRFRFRRRGRRSRRLLSRALVGLAQDAARPLRGAPVLRAARNLFQLAPIPSNASSATSRSIAAASARTLSSPSLVAMTASARGSSSFATAARRTRASGSSRATSVSSSWSVNGIS